jgi:hypothetical protein
MSQTGQLPTWGSRWPTPLGRVEKVIANADPAHDWTMCSFYGLKTSEIYALLCELRARDVNPRRFVFSMAFRGSDRPDGIEIQPIDKRDDVRKDWELPDWLGVGFDDSNFEDQQRFVEAMSLAREEYTTYEPPPEVQKLEWIVNGLIVFLVCLIIYALFFMANSYQNYAITLAILSMWVYTHRRVWTCLRQSKQSSYPARQEWAREVLKKYESKSQ